MRKFFKNSLFVGMYLGIIFSAIIPAPVFAQQAEWVDGTCDRGVPDPNQGQCVDENSLPTGPIKCPNGYNFDPAQFSCHKTAAASANPTGGNTGNTGNSGNTAGSGLCEGFSERNGICVPEYGGFQPGSVARSTSIGALATLIIRVLLTLSGMIAVVLIIVGGFQFIMSRGNEEAATKGKKTLTYAVVGLIVVIMSFVIVSVVTGTLTNSDFLGTLVGGGNTSGGGSVPRP